MKKYIKEIKNIVNESDPWDLISEGAPEDEYEEYINKIFSLVVKKKYSFESLKSLFKEVDESKLKEMDSKLNKVITSFPGTR